MIRGPVLLLCSIACVCVRVAHHGRPMEPVFSPSLCSPCTDRSVAFSTPPIPPAWQKWQQTRTKLCGTSPQRNLLTKTAAQNLRDKIMLTVFENHIKHKIKKRTLWCIFFFNGTEYVSFYDRKLIFLWRPFGFSCGPPPPPHAAKAHVIEGKSTLIHQQQRQLSSGVRLMCSKGKHADQQLSAWRIHGEGDQRSEQMEFLAIRNKNQQK